MLKHLKNISYLTVSQIIISISIFAINLIWARGYSTENYGTYKLLISTISIFSVFALSGLNNTLIISSGKFKEKNFNKIFKLKLIIGIILSLILFFSLKELIFFKDLSKFTIILLSILFPLYVNNNNWRYFFQGNSNFKDFFQNNLIESISVLLIVFICFSIGFDYQLLICFLIGSRVIINNIFNLKLIFANHRKPSDISLIKKGYNYTPGFIIGSLLLLENYIIQFNLSTEDVAKFSIMILFPLQLKTIYELSNKLLTEKIVRLKIFEFWDWYKKNLLIIIFFYSIIGILGFFSVEHLINFFFGNKYQEIASGASKIFLIYSFNFPISYLNQSLNLNGFTKHHFFYQTTTTILKLTLLYGLTISLGLDGVVLVFLFTTIFNWLFVLTSFKINYTK